MKIEIVVYDTPPSNNEFMGNSRNFNEYRRQKEAWHWLMKAAIKKKPKVPIKRALVEIKYYFKIRRRRTITAVNLFWTRWLMRASCKTIALATWSYGCGADLTRLTPGRKLR